MRLNDGFIDMLYREFPQEVAHKIIQAYDQKEPVRGLKMNEYKCVTVPFDTHPSSLNETIQIPEDYKMSVVHPFHHAGCYYIQDPSATLPVRALNPQPTDCVLDMCAAPGGKTTQILNSIHKGFLISNEHDYTRALKLVGNVERWGVENCVVVNHDGTHLPKYFPNTFDKIVLDVPCSGEGLYRKQPEHAQNFSMKTIHDLASLQYKLLEAAYQCCVNEGEIVYSTCTINPYENEDVILKFLETHTQCELMDPELPNVEPGIKGLGTRVARTYPSEYGEGHFIAKIKVHKEDKRSTLQFKKFKSQSIQLNGITFTGHIVSSKEKITLLKHRGPLDSKASIIHDGSIIGLEKKGRVEFTQACAHSIDFAHILPKFEVDLETAYRYLYGLSLDNPNNGYHIVTYKGQCLGFIKGSNNKYPKGLRNRFERYDSKD